MSVPGNINTAPPPSSFDDNSDFYEESRWAKLKRKIIQEPLIPLGCALTVWALLEATKSIRSGDKNRTNRMFRRRIYAQGFTILAMLGGSIYWENDRKKRNEYDELIEDKKKKDQHEAWLRELEARDEEEMELRKMRDRMVLNKIAEKQKGLEEKTSVLETSEKKKGMWGSVRSVVEEGEQNRDGPIVAAVRNLWERRR